MAGAIAAHSSDPGIFVENKLRSLSIHYPARAADQSEARRAIQAAIAHLVPAPRLIGGKCVFNLVPEGAADKGDALVRLVRHDGCDGRVLHRGRRHRRTRIRARDDELGHRARRLGRVDRRALLCGPADGRVRCIDRIVATPGRTLKVLQIVNGAFAARDAHGRHALHSRLLHSGARVNATQAVLVDRRSTTCSAASDLPRRFRRASRRV